MPSNVDKHHKRGLRQDSFNWENDVDSCEALESSERHQVFHRTSDVVDRCFLIGVFVRLDEGRYKT